MFPHSEIEYFTKKAFFAKDLVDSENSPNKRVESKFRNMKRWYNRLFYNRIFSYFGTIILTNISRNNRMGLLYKNCKAFVPHPHCVVHGMGCCYCVW